MDTPTMTNGKDPAKARVKESAEKVFAPKPEEPKPEKPAPVVHSDAGFAAGKLRSYIERIERLEEEKAALGSDLREVYSEARGQGFDSKIMRKVVVLRKMETADRQEMESLLDKYLAALGMK